MAIEIVMPKLGWTMEEGILDEWVKQDGDEVQVGDVVFVVESDKALQEIESFDSGILRILPDAPPTGSTIKIGELLAYLVQPGEAPPFELKQTREVSGQSATHPQAVDTSQPASAPLAKTSPERGRYDRPAISPRAKRVAIDLVSNGRSLRAAVAPAASSNVMCARPPTWLWQKVKTGNCK